MTCAPNSFLFLIYLIFFSSTMNGQDWTVIGNDPIDTEMTDFVEIVEVACRLESDRDSLALRIVIDTSGFLFEPDFGIAIGIDTNLILLDGMEDFESSNNDINPDVVFSYLTNSGFPNFLPEEIKYISETKDTLILKVELAEWDADLSFNFVLGAVLWNFGDSHRVWDVVPNNGIFPINFHTHVSDTKWKVLEFYPNPVADYLKISNLPLKSKYHINDAYGNKVSEGSFDGSIDVSSLEKGAYIVNFGNEIKGFRFLKI